LEEILAPPKRARIKKSPTISEGVYMHDNNHRAYRQQAELFKFLIALNLVLLPNRYQRRPHVIPNAIAVTNYAPCLLRIRPLKISKLRYLKEPPWLMK
jgi:hypothetical protein